MGKAWLKEQARDLIAFGSIPFLVLTIARVSVMDFYYPMQFVLSSSLFFILRLIFKGDSRAGISFILLVFTSLYYGSLLFAVFAVLVFAGVVVSLLYLQKEKRDVFAGALLGMFSAGIGYAIVKLILR